MVAVDDGAFLADKDLRVRRGGRGQQSDEHEQQRE